MPDNENAPKKPGHNLADHQYGADAGHTHDGDEAFDHDHDDFGLEGGPEGSGLWIQDHVSLTSVGIDIGSAGTQLIFSRIHLRRLGEDLSSRYCVVSRETLFQSPVALTPYHDEERIDEGRSADIIDDAYAQAGLHPDQIDSGVVILTGEALRRQNAQAISELLAENGGEFVCTAAGHHLEAMLAAYGSGAARVSHDEDKRILNVDIGGGTTKLAVVEGGRIEAMAAVHIGGRLQVVDAGERIVRLDPAGRHLAAAGGLLLERGRSRGARGHGPRGGMDGRRADRRDPGTPPAARDRAPLPHRPDRGARAHRRRDVLRRRCRVRVCEREPRLRRHGQAARHRHRAPSRAGALPWPLLPPGECIRATAVGASEYSVQLSGNTIYISSPGDLLPRKNLQVLLPPYVCREEIVPEELARAIRGHFTAFDLEEGAVRSGAGVPLGWRALVPAHRRLRAGYRHGPAADHREAESRSTSCSTATSRRRSGAILREELKLANEILVIDGVTLWDLDYIDLGRIRLPSHTVPVTIKSLVFSEDPRHPNDPGQYHRHHGEVHYHHHHHDHDHDHDHGHGEGHGHHHHLITTRRVMTIETSGMSRGSRH